MDEASAKCMAGWVSWAGTSRLQVIGMNFEVAQTFPSTRISSAFRILRLCNQVPDPNRSARNNIRPQAASMDQPSQHSFCRQPFQILAGLAQSCPAQPHNAQ